MHTRWYRWGFFILGMGTIIFSLMPPRPQARRQRVAPFLEGTSLWADSVLANMSLSEKLQRYLLIEVTHPDDLDTLDFRPGGLVFNGLTGTTIRQIQQRWDRPGYVPLFYTLKGNPSGIRDYQTHIYPASYHEAADSLNLAVHQAYLAQLKLWGIHMWIRPGLQAYQDNAAFAEMQKQLAAEQIQTQTANVLYGLDNLDLFYPTDRDSLLRHTLMDAYDTLMQYGLSGLTLTHQSLSRIPADLRANSPQISPYLAREGYRGLLLSHPSGTTLAFRSRLRQAILAGSDQIIVSPNQASEALALLREMVDLKLLTPAELERRLRRSLKAQYWAQGPGIESLPEIPAARVLNARLRQQAPALIRNPEGGLPLVDLYQSAVHLLQIGDEFPHMLSQMRRYGPVSHSHLEQGEALVPRNYRKYRPVFIALKWDSDSLPDSTLWHQIDQLAQQRPVLVVNFNDPLLAAKVPMSAGLIQAYHTDSLGQVILGQCIMGGKAFSGKAPLEVPNAIAMGQRIPLPATRLGFGFPEMAGLSESKLRQIDSIAYEGISRFAMPGCQVLVARKGEVVYAKSFGYHTYTRRRPVQLTDVFDIASVSKVAGTTVATMRMRELGRLSLRDRLKRFFKDRYVTLDSANRTDTVFIPNEQWFQAFAQRGQDSGVQAIPVVARQSFLQKIDTIAHPDSNHVMLVRTFSRGKVRQRSQALEIRLANLLTHHSGLPAGIPRLKYLQYTRRGLPRYGGYFNPRRTPTYSIEVAKNMYFRKDYMDSLWEDTKRMYVDPDSSYRYSDANMILMQMAIDSINRIPMDSFLMQEIYLPMGLQYLRYHPLRYIESKRIVPTETDRSWRYQSLRGYVHDETAALWGGMAGNAGIFSNVVDLGHLFQMILSGGTYGGKRYIRESTVKQFTRPQKGTRGFGFDLVGPRGHNYAGGLATPGTYGHTGYTGTCVWVDPSEELIFIFLSNRVHPTRRNRDINTYRIRQRMHDAAYRAMMD